MTPAKISASDVLHNPAAHRYEVSVGGQLALADYRVEQDRVVMTHTFVPPDLRGRGIAEVLVRVALEDVRRHGQRVVPQCSYVARFIAQHPAYQDLLA